MKGQDSLTPDQQAAIDFVYERDEAMLCLPMGFGKTVVAMTAIQEMLADDILNRVLVVAPLKVCTDTWAYEHTQWSHLRPVAVATGSEAQRRAVIEGDAEVVVINFENLPWLFSMSGSSHGFDGLVIDELTRMAGGGAQFKALRKRLGDFVWRVGMTGTLVEEGLDRLFYQVMCLDNGRRFGRNKARWLQQYFVPLDWEARRWGPQEGASERLAAQLDGLVYEARMVASDGVPELVEETVFVTLSQRATEAYADMCLHMVAEGVEAANAAVASGKLQQICSGFMYSGGDVIDLGDFKFRCLAQVIKDFSMSCSSQTLIVYQFVDELARLRVAYPDGRELRDTGAVDAWNAGRLGVLFLHPASGGHGLNLQSSGCDLVVFLGPLWSSDRTRQVVARVCRRGNPAGVVRAVTLAARGTLEDQAVMPRVAGKGAAAGAFMAHVRRVVQGA